MKNPEYLLNLIGEQTQKIGLKRMPNHPNRKWRSRWVVDLAARTATHRDGWVFKFAPEPDDGGGIDGKCIAQPSLAAYDKNKLQATLSRIAREAGDIYIEAKNAKG